MSGHVISRRLVPLTAALALTSCLPTFDVNVATPEPIDVDLDMDVHVYQHGKTDEAAAEARATYRTAMKERRDRMSQIQELKNNRLVGENHRGLLTIRNRPAGDYGDYVEKTVEAENRDRETLMRHEAGEQDVPLQDIRREQWRHWQRKSFPGEWIEIAEEDGGYRWEQKQAADEANSE